MEQLCCLELVVDVGTSHSAKQTVSTPLVLVQTVLTPGKTLDPTYIYTACDRVRASQPALISEASTLIGQPMSRGHCINMRLRAKCTHVFLCQDATRRALEPPYSGPYQVLSRRDKTLQLLIRGRPVAYRT
jgi:hypothetical protein